MKSRPRQSGVALITAVLVVSLATIAATSVLDSGHLSVQRTATLQDSEKAWWYAMGVEDLVRLYLKRDAEDNDTDALNEAWAKPIDYLPVEQGFVSGALVDQQGLFNLNNLGVQDPELFQTYQEQFERLLSAIPDVDPFLARPLAQAIRDWIDADQEPTVPDGAEDSEYLVLDPGYRAANQPMQSVTELLAMRGMTREHYVRIRPFVTALPQAPSPINVNTAPPEVLRSLVVNPSPGFENFLRRREQQPAEAITDLNDEGVFSPEDADSSMLTVSSRFFQMQAQATVGNGRVALYSLIFRPSSGTPIVISRNTDSE